MDQAQNLIENASLDADTLRLVSRALDEAWEAIAGNYGAASAIDTARLRLAKIILDIAVRGGRDLELIKVASLQTMRDGERPLQFPQAHRN